MKFLPFRGEYEKEFYDVLLNTGEVVKDCWPNAGKFTATDNSGRQFYKEDIKGVCIQTDNNSTMSDDYQKHEYVLTNREKSKQAKLGKKHWCMSCDAHLVGQYGKCPICGAYSNRKKIKGI